MDEDQKNAFWSLTGEIPRRYRVILWLSDIFVPVHWRERLVIEPLYWLLQEYRQSPPIFLAILFFGTTCTLGVLLLLSMRRGSNGTKSKSPYPGPLVLYAKVYWKSIHYYTGNIDTDRLIVCDPQCPKCQAPLVAEPPKGARCPTCRSLYVFEPNLETAKESAKRHAIGMYKRGELVFPGQPEDPTIIRTETVLPEPIKSAPAAIPTPTVTRRKLGNGLRYDVCKSRGRLEPAYCPDEACDTRVTFTFPGGYGVRRGIERTWKCPGCDKSGEYNNP